jgi:hypothetical protein
MLFQPLPTTGSSGGPIVDESTGAVVGVMLGTRMDSSIEGVRGWGVPAETIFEVREEQLVVNSALIRLSDVQPPWGHAEGIESRCLGS